MNKLLVYPLLILLLLSAWNQFFTYSEEPNLSYEDTFQYEAPSGSLTQNGTSTEMEYEDVEASFNIDTVTGYIALIIAIIIVGVIAGIRVLGSGLSDFSVKLIYKSTFCFGLWGIGSALTYTMFAELPLAFGIIIWLGMTLLYCMGFYQSTVGGGG